MALGLPLLILTVGVGNLQALAIFRSEGFPARGNFFGFTAGAGLLMVVPIALTAGVAVLGDFTSALRTGNAEGDQLTRLLLTALSPFISLTVLMFIYRFLPNTLVRFRDIWPTALLTALALRLLHAPTRALAAVVPLMAGMLQLPARHVYATAALSAAVWALLLMSAAHLFPAS